MSSSIAKVFMSGRSQAVRLPKAFRLPGKEVRVRKVDGGLLLEPITDNLEEIFAAMDRLGEIEIERDQPPMPSLSEDWN